MAGPTGQENAMTFKTILAHCDGEKTVASRLEVATGLARRFGSHLVGLNVQPPFEAPVFVDTGFAMEPLYRAYESNVAVDRAAAREAFDLATRDKALSKEWREDNGPIDDQLALHARYADLTVIGQANPDSDSMTPSDLPETVALASGRPVLAVPYVGVKKPPGKVVMLCWNASREAARAATEALSLLKTADKVIVLAIDARRSNDGHGDEPGADVATWLARHRVNVTVQRDTAADADVGNIILSRAADHDADLIVMGLYGHSRAREFILGGASRTILASMTLPVFMAH
jgi:nucleotide-binding universal stress UspA family protein